MVINFQTEISIGDDPSLYNYEIHGEISLLSQDDKLIKIGSMDVQTGKKN